MSQLHWLSNYQAIDANGEIIVGALLYSFEGGTTTPKTTYDDNALSSANTNPIVADANGYFGPIFVRPEDIKFELRNASDVTIWTLDNANAEEDVIRPTRFTGVASGTANDLLITASDVPETYVDGQVIQFVAAATNTGPMTVNVNSIGVRDIVRQGGAALSAGDVDANFPYSIQYVASIDDFVIQGLDGLFAGTEVETPSASDDFLFLTDTSASGTSIKSTVANVLTNTATSVTLTDAANISWDMAASKDAQVTVTADRALDAPTNTEDSKTGLLIIEQDGTGGWDITFNAVYKFSGGVALQPSQGANERTIYLYTVQDSSNIQLTRLWMEGNDSVGFFREFDEGTYTLTTETTRAHGLGRYPAIVQAYLENTSAELGFSVGDRIAFGGGEAEIESGLGRGVTIKQSTTNVVVITANNAVRVVDGDSPSNPTAVITPANWDLVLRIYE